MYKELCNRIISCFAKQLKKVFFDHQLIIYDKKLTSKNDNHSMLQYCVGDI